MLALVLLAALGDARPAAPLSEQAILGSLDQTLDWYRHLVGQTQPGNDPADAFFAADVVDSARQATALAFDAARAEAALLPSQPAGGAVAAAPTLEARAAAAADAAQKAQQRVAALEKGAPKRGSQRDQLAEARSELALAQARAQTLKSLADFMTQTGGAANTGLAGQIDELERTVPEVRSRREKAPAPAPAAKPAVQGVLGAFSELFSLTHRLHGIRDASDRTLDLRSACEKLRAPLIADLRATLQQADQLEAPTLAERTARLDQLTDRFRKLSAAVVPSAKQIALLGAIRGDLNQWRGALDDEYGGILRDLLLRLGVLVAVLAGIFAASRLWRRATLLYVKDPRRRQQSLLVRRIVISAVVVVAVIFSLVSELGSLATFAGFITAGLAVALQNVILSVAAYFFLIGKYGIRVGDRVQIGDVVGDVIDIGLVRLHVMELRGDGLPTGRVVVFSNSVAFSNSNFFKQMPGSRFTWHEVKLTLAPDTDYRVAEERLMKAANQVFEEYREPLERQHADVAENVTVDLRAPRPESRIRLTASGLEMLVRYPVPLDQASAVDDRMTRTLLGAIESESRLKLSVSGPTTLQPATSH